MHDMAVSTTQLTILSSMADQDFERALDRHRAWGISHLDLRDGIYGKWLADVTRAEAAEAAASIRARGLAVHCLSTGVFFDDIRKGRDAFVDQHLPMLDHILGLAEELQPHFVRLIAAQLPERDRRGNAIDLVARDHPWVFDVYREAIDRVAAAGFRPTIENEYGDCILSSVAEFRQFFAALDRPESVGLTWDVQNQWSTGVFPTMEVYEGLRDLIEYYHVKGGRSADGSRRLAWNVALEEADWAVLDITRRVVDDGVSPVICINPPQHGAPIDDYDYAGVTERDLRFLRDHVKGIA